MADRDGCVDLLDQEPDRIEIEITADLGPFRLCQHGAHDEQPAERGVGLGGRRVATGAHGLVDHQSVVLPSRAVPEPLDGQFVTELRRLTRVRVDQPVHGGEQPVRQPV
jgi:hypothetical protein